MDIGGMPLDEVRRSYGDGRPVLLSIEPWPLEGRSKDTLLEDITAGDYDPVIDQLAKSISSLGQPILLRFGHEMDITGLYPWADAQPDAYVAAYRHFVDRCRRQGLDNAIWVWSPGGTLAALDYYPGDQYVDYVGTTILEYSGWESDAGYATPRPISTLIEEKYQLLKDLDKPIILAETGIAIESTLKKEALIDIVDVIDRYPLVRAIVYFNSRNPETPLNTDRPDWSLTDQDIAVLREAIDGSAWFER